MIDVKDIKLGFWIGAGLALWALVVLALQWVLGRAQRNG